jgi:malonate-semialdehyde dehydrogenase (acetylating)/methylmalonate-semialdehyde dehydrogenase
MSQFHCRRMARRKRWHACVQSVHGEVIAECPAGGADDVNAAVEAAAAAFPAWSETPPVERARVMFR